ncbi:MAG: TIGR00266 family protein [Anaerovoracaceae bacterium]|nr:TIGR00266 family protein [Anaerovoracaceae bacterium]
MKYDIRGGNLPFVVCELDSGETVINESGSMAWMSPNMKMETTSNGGVGKMLGRMVSGESLFMNRYTAVGGPGMITFASSFPGEIRVFQISDDNPLIVQKRAYLAAEESVDLSIFFRKKLGAGLFGGEGFIMEKLAGNGTAFLEIDGSAMEYQLGPGEQIIADTGYVVAMDATCTMEVQTVKGAKNILFGGEGLFNTVVTGPGKVILQSMPIISVAAELASFMPQK